MGVNSLFMNVINFALKVWAQRCGTGFKHKYAFMMAEILAHAIF